MEECLECKGTLTFEDRKREVVFRDKVSTYTETFWVCRKCGDLYQDDVLLSKAIINYNNACRRAKDIPSKTKLRKARLSVGDRLYVSKRLGVSTYDIKIIENGLREPTKEYIKGLKNLTKEFNQFRKREDRFIW